jgi:flagellar hook protein FlgE
MDVERQGLLHRTEQIGDLAIDGRGFLPVYSGFSDVLGGSRAGTFQLDPAGYLVDDAGNRLLAQRIGSKGKTNLELVRIDARDVSGTPTSKLTLETNLSSLTAAGAVRSAVVPVYDKDGGCANLELGFKRLSPAETRACGGQEWGLFIVGAPDSVRGMTLSCDRKASTYCVDSKKHVQSGDPIDKKGPIALLKMDDSTHRVAGVNTEARTLTITWENGATSEIALDLKAVEYDADIARRNSEGQAAGKLTVKQDGRAEGQFTGWDITGSGVVEALRSNGDVLPLYKLELIDCASPNRMMERNGVYYATQDSGEFRNYAPGTHGAGEIEVQTREHSTVSVAQELSDAVVTQHAYAANAKTITTIDEMLKTLAEL